MIVLKMFNLLSYNAMLYGVLMPLKLMFVNRTPYTNKYDTMKIHAITEMQNKVKRMKDIDTLIYEVMQTKYAQNEAIKLNKSQLRDFGIDARGVVIETLRSAIGEVYSLYAINIKKELGQPTDKVTLYDTGSAQDSMSMDISFNSYVFTMNFQKEDGNIMDNLPNDTEVLGLTDGSIKTFAHNVMKPMLLKLMRGILNS